MRHDTSSGFCLPKAAPQYHITSRMGARLGNPNARSVARTRLRFGGPNLLDVDGPGYRAERYDP